MTSFDSWLLLTAIGTHLNNFNDVSFIDIQRFSHLRTFSIAFITRFISSLALALVSLLSARGPNFVGLLEVKNSKDTSIEQIFFPGTVENDDVKIQWNRAYWGGNWTAWIKIVNNDQIVVGGIY